MPRSRGNGGVVGKVIIPGTSGVVTSQEATQFVLSGQWPGSTYAVASSGGVGPTITSIVVTDSGYNNLDDTAAATSNSYIRILGTGFESTANVFLDGTMVPKSNITFTSSTEIRVNLPVSNTGNYTVSLYNSNSSGALYSNTFVVSTMPQWLTSSTLANTFPNTAFSFALSATSDSSVTYGNTTTIPTGTTLAANGLFSGNVGVISTYSFDVKATDAQNQDTTRTFTLSIVVPISQQLFTTTTQSTGDYNYFTVPDDIYSISAVVVGGGGGGCRSTSAGGGGSGGDLRWIKSIDVIPGEILKINVGAGGLAASPGGDGNPSQILRANDFVLLSAAGGGGGTTSVVRAKNGTSTTTSGTGAVGPIGGGNGGNGGQGEGSTNSAGGGGAGGYLGNGGNGALASPFQAGSAAAAGSGGGGGGGAAGNPGTNTGRGGQGGGVGVLGLGSSGAGGAYAGAGGGGGGGGSGGTIGGYGSGGGGDDTGTTAHDGGQGVVRLIWPAELRYYANTRTADE